MGFLGHREADGRAPETSLGEINPILATGWVVEFTPQNLGVPGDFEVFHGFATGPGGFAYVYIDTSGYGVLENGSINEYAPSGKPMYVRPGQSIKFYWSVDSGTGPAPHVVLWLQTPGSA